MSEAKEMNEEVVVEVADETEEETVSEVKTSRFKDGLKKYGKKLAIGAGVLAVGIVGFILGRKTNADYDEQELLELGYDPDDDVVHYDSEDEDETE